MNSDKYFKVHRNTSNKMPIDTQTKKEWFTQWFDSAYYHLLYQHRDDTEAQRFISSLLKHLDLKPKAKVLDLGCGKGRHARFLAKNGLDVTGADIAANSIAAAKAYEHEHLKFCVHDMRKPLKTDYFDAVFSFFTAFGYFVKDAEHLDSLQYVHQNLKKNGLFVMDFMNAVQVQKNLVPKESKSIDGVQFNIKRYIRHKTVFKRIEFTTKTGEQYWFRERVRLFTRSELSALFEKANLELLEVFGNYQLEAFDAEHSPRLILIAKAR